MKKIFQFIGLISLISFSFIFTESTYNVALEMDELMDVIKEKQDEYKINKIEGKIDKGNIIPGISGRIVNIKKSYYNMKKVGKFIPSLIIYDEEKLTNSINNNLDKYIISGNKNKKMVSLSFIVNSDTNISIIKNILNKNKISGNFFVDYDYLIKNKNEVKNLISNNHIIGNLNKINSSDIILIDSSFKTTISQENTFCYSEVDDANYLKLCALNGSYSIKPLLIENNPYKTVKENLEGGSLFMFKINKQLEIELQTIINFIKSKGLKIENLEIHLEENSFKK